MWENNDTDKSETWYFTTFRGKHSFHYFLGWVRKTLWTNIRKGKRWKWGCYIHNHPLLTGVMCCIPNQAFSVVSRVPSPSHSFFSLLPCVTTFIIHLRLTEEGTISEDSEISISKVWQEKKEKKKKLSSNNLSFCLSPPVRTHLLQGTSKMLS